MDYEEFIFRKSQLTNGNGFAPIWMPGIAKPFQVKLTDWSLRRGRSAIFADCGLGKTLMQLVWAANVSQYTNGRVLIATPLAVSRQTVREADKFGVDLSKIDVTNYERLHHCESSDYMGFVCDESSILKNVSGATRKQVTRFTSKMKYRLLCTATAAPNDWVELGTSSEALGELSHSEMLKRFFRQLDNKGQSSEQKKQDEAERLIASDPNYYKKLAYRVSQTIGQWRLKHHAVDHFWRWVASWATACRKPSDIGCDDTGYDLPKLIENDHVIKSRSLPPGRLFSMPAFGLAEEREERKRTIVDRVEYAAQLVSHDRPAVVWCHTNDEGDMLEKTIPGARQIAGRTPDEEKIEIFEAFASGQLKKLVIKPKIGAWGLNWQHCSHVVKFASHSYEQDYQAIRRCYRYGQANDVTVDTIATEGEVRVLENSRRKAEKANAMFASLIRHMNNSTTIARKESSKKKVEVPQWLTKNI